MRGIFLMAFYCEAYEFNEGQCLEQCALCRQEDADEEVMRDHFDDEPYISAPNSQEKP